MLFVWRVAGRNEKDTVQLHGVPCLSGNVRWQLWTGLKVPPRSPRRIDRRSHCEPAGKLRMKAITVENDEIVTMDDFFILLNPGSC